VFATAASFQDPIEAQIVCGLLQSAGIDAMVADFNLISVNWPMAQALGGVKVQVPHADLDEARKLIAAYEAGELRRGGGDSENEDRCGLCGGTDLAKVVPASQKALALAAFAVAAAPISTRTRRVCNSCGAVETAD
jgi:hypothetical protein